MNQTFDMGAKTMALPLKEKLKFEQGNDGMSFGFVFNIPSPPKLNINPELFTIDTKPQVQMLQMSMAPWISQSS